MFDPNERPKGLVLGLGIKNILAFEYGFEYQFYFSSDFCEVPNYSFGLSVRPSVNNFWT